MKIVFYCPMVAYSTYVFDGYSLYSGVGGSEGALINLARALSLRGHEVIIYNSVPETIIVENVVYQPVHQFQENNCDIFVLFRFYHEVIHSIKTAFTVLWSHDIPTTEKPYSLEKSIQFVDMIVVVSHYHAHMLLKFVQQCGLGNDELSIHIGGNGVWASDYMFPITKIPYRFIYCSVPDRGLRPLLEMWPRIREKVVDACLTVTGGYQLWGRDDNDDELRMLVNQPGIRFLGVISRTQLVQEQLAAEIHLHPCSIPENFCLASMECQAAGTPSIASRVGALPTTIIHNKTGIIVANDPEDAGFQSAFIEAAVELVHDRTTLAIMSSQARYRALHEFDYAVVAEQWEMNISKRLQEKQSLS